MQSHRHAPEAGVGRRWEDVLNKASCKSFKTAGLTSARGERAGLTYPGKEVVQPGQVLVQRQEEFSNGLGKEREGCAWERVT